MSTVTPRLYWLKKLKSVGIDELSLIIIYKTHHRSVIAYAAPAWFPHTGEVSRDKLEKLQKSALKRIDSNKSYEEALAYYNLPTIRSFLKKIQMTHFSKLFAINHPLHHLLPPLTAHGKTTRQKNHLYVGRWKSEKRRKSFIIDSSSVF